VNVPDIRMCIRSVSVRGRFELLHCMNKMGLKIAMTCQAFDMCLFLVKLCLVYHSSVPSIIDKARLQLCRVTAHGFFCYITDYAQHRWSRVSWGL